MKCKHCKSIHKNKGGVGKIQDICFSCEFVENTLLALIKSINLYTPKTGKQRKVTLLDYKIEINDK